LNLESKTMIYLDNSATTRTAPRAAEAVHKYMTEEYFNPAAAYSAAVREEKAVNAARRIIAEAIGADAGGVIFTSGGTESNNMAILGGLKPMRGRGRIIAGAAEHPSVYEVCRGLSGEYDFHEAPLNSTGSVDIERLCELITPDTKLVSIMQVNNETGAVNDIAAIGAMLSRRAPGALLHVDGVQGFLKVPFQAAWCHMYSVSAHKFHGPKGVGALYVRPGVRFAGGQTGGGQEHGLRSGTLNTPGIMGMAEAVQEYRGDIEARREHMRRCKLRLAERLTALPEVYINGPAPEAGAPHILNVSFMGVRGEVLLHALEEREIYVSTGSACSAHKKGGNRILSAMGIKGERQEGAIRFSLCPENTIEEMDRAAEETAAIITTLRRFKRR